MNKLNNIVKFGLYTVGFGGGTQRIEAFSASDAIRKAKADAKLEGLDLRGRGKSFVIIAFDSEGKEEK